MAAGTFGRNLQRLIPSFHTSVQDPVPVPTKKWYMNGKGRVEFFRTVGMVGTAEFGLHGQNFSRSPPVRSKR